jgi:hypothetical protein
MFPPHDKSQPVLPISEGIAKTDGHRREITEVPLETSNHRRKWIIPRPGYQKRKEKDMRMRILKAEDLEPESFVFAPQHSTGLLLGRKIVEVEAIDWGNHIEVTTEDEIKHVLNADDEVLVSFQR